MLRPVHPGEVLADEIAELNISPSELARQLKVPANRITQIIKGQRGVSGDTAVRLGRWFGMSAEFWMNLQSDYEIKLARHQLGSALDKIPTRDAA